MKTIFIMVLSILMMSTSTFAEEKLTESASSKLTIYSPSEWKIEKLSNGFIVMDDINQELLSQYPKLRITNGTSISSPYYIAITRIVNHGDEGGEGVYFQPQKLTGRMRTPYHIGMEHDVWGFLKLDANQTEDIILVPTHIYIKPGLYTVNLQLIVPAP